MSLLLDTHVVLWWLNGELPADVHELLRTEPNVRVSAVTPWEVSIKQARGRLAGPRDLPERTRDTQFLPLPVTADHGVRAGRLPPHHHDPFDRILIAQAQLERLTLVTRDTIIPKYDVEVMPV